MADERHTIRAGETPSLISWSMVAGFLAWGLDLGFSYGLQRTACSSGNRFWLHLVTIVCFIIALSGLFLGIREARMLPHDRKEEGRRPHDRAHFQALLGMIFCIAFAVVILAGAIPRWILDACD